MPATPATPALSAPPAPPAPFDPPAGSALGDVRRVARETFAIAEPTPWQEEAAAAAAGGDDVLLVAPTGGGKSLVYQVAGVIRSGWTLVVSPLLALQADQLAHLDRAEGVRSARLSSDEPAGRRARTLRDVVSGRLDFVFLAPEQLANDDVRSRLRECPPSLVAVDEAHCVSEWGHDFRPDYLRLGTLLAELGEVPVLAMTATASPPVRASIVEHLDLRDPHVVVADLARPNLALSVFREPDRRRQLDRVRTLVLAREPGTAGIVYGRTRRGCEELAAALVDAGVAAGHFHAGLPRRRRAEVQEEFMTGGIDVLVATSAFGMGVDRPDLRFVVHAEATASVDAYVQEVGRAGRDGRPAEGLLVYRPEDLALGRFFAAGVPRRATVDKVLAAVQRCEGRVDPAEIARLSGVGRRSATRILNLLELADEPTADAVRERAEAQQRLERSRVDLVRQYAETSRCRAEFLLAQLGEHAERCGTCDTCRAGVADEPSSDDGLDDAVVHHPDFGRGAVTESLDDRVTVLFEDVGYKTLARAVVEDRGMVDAADG